MAKYGQQSYRNGTIIVDLGMTLFCCQPCSMIVLHVFAKYKCVANCWQKRVTMIIILMLSDGRRSVRQTFGSVLTYVVDLVG